MSVPFRLSSQAPTLLATPFLGLDLHALSLIFSSLDISLPPWLPSAGLILGGT